MLVHLKLVLCALPACLFAHAPAEIVQLAIAESTMTAAASMLIAKCAEVILNLVDRLLHFATKLEEFVANALAKSLRPVLVSPGTKDGHFERHRSTDARSGRRGDDKWVNHCWLWRA